MLHVHRAERADRLVDALAAILAESLEDPLATEVISVHSRGIERWISQRLSDVLGTGPAGTDGVCALVDFPFPATLIRGAVAAGSGIDPDADPWLPERLTWPLLEVVEEHRGDDMLGPLRVHLEGDPASPRAERTDRRFGAVRHIADLFDRYGVHRPEMIRDWRDDKPVGPEGGPLSAAHRWQYELWRAVAARIDQPSFAERHATAIAALRDEPDVVDLPPRLALFGLTAIPASYLTVLDAIGAHRDVHLMLLHPSDDLWGRVAATTETRGQPLWSREDDPTETATRNPLLASWGRDVRELQLVAPVPADADNRHYHPVAPGDAGGPTTATGSAAPGDATESTGSADSSEPIVSAESDGSVSLLRRLQADVRADRFPGPIQPRPEADQRAQLDAGDLSVQFHDCHGRLRQVEVLRDTVLHLLADEPDLEPRDIIVMCPDVEAFAPLVTAVFGAEAVLADTRSDTDADIATDGRRPPALRVRLADRSIRRTNPVLEVVALVLELVDGRMTASAVLDLLSREPVRRRFRLDDDDLELVESWVADLQIRWGLDAQHRRRQGLPELHANTWDAGLERLLLGIAMADENLRLIDGVAPYDGVEGKASHLAGRLVEFVQRLRTAAEAMHAPQPIDAWRTAIGAGADALTATAPDATWQRLQLHRVLDDLVDEATVDDDTSPVELSLGEIRRLLDDRLRGQPSRTSHRTGDLTVCTLVPMRSVPHRVVCLLGLDDDSFPRRTVPDSDDLLQRAPRVGDRDPRSEDRQLLLDALLAATETLVVTYSGRDERSNEDRPPAVPVDELRDVVDRTVIGPDCQDCSDDDRASAHLTTRHPLQEHDPRAFEPGRYRPDDRPWSFDPAALAAARAAAGDASPVPAFLSGELEVPDEDTVELDDLVAFLQHPVKAFARQRLDVTLPSGDDQVSDAIPSTLKGLDAWRVGEEMIPAWRDGDDLARAEEVARARGLVPPGQLAGDDLDTVRSRVKRITKLCEHLDIDPRRRRSVDIEVELADGRLLVGTVPDVAGWQIQAISYSRVGAKHRLAAWARFLAGIAHRPDAPWTAATVGRHAWKRGDMAQARLLEGFRGSPDTTRKTAMVQLERLIDLFDRGRSAPIPLYCDSSLKSAEQLYKDEPADQYVKYEWETNPYAGFDREDRDPYHLLVLGRQVPTDELFEEICRDEQERSWADDERRFVAYAWRLWEPILSAERSCEQ